MYNIPVMSIKEAESAGLVELMIFSPGNEIIESQFGTMQYSSYLEEEANRILSVNVDRQVAIVRQDRLVALFVNPMTAKKLN